LTGLTQLRLDLKRPDLTADDAIWLLENVEAVPAWQQAARFRYLPELTSMSTAQIGEVQNCSRGPVCTRLRKWCQKAQALLAEREEK
jgi:hypothetical protein